MSYVILIVGFALLTKGADFFVDGAAAVASKLKVPTFIIGMTIVAMGTSAPECAVSITAALKNNNQLAISNAVGSNIFNLMVVCGMCALVSPLAVETGILKKEFPFSVLVAILLLAAGLTGMSVGRIDGILLLVVFCAFLFVMVRSAQKARKQQATNISDDDDQIQDLGILRCMIYILGGLAAIVLGGDWVVDGASVIAESFGMSQNLIGLTVVAFGTSLPELVTSFTAAKKGQADMALGNVIGSNIFNILLIIGVAGIIRPISYNSDYNMQMVILMLGMILLFSFPFIPPKDKISRNNGFFLLGLYVIYMFLLFMI